MRRRRGASPTGVLDLAGLRPRADLTGCYHFPEPTGFRYRLAHHHHLILLHAGALDAHTVNGDFSAGPRDLVCFRPAPINAYRVIAGTVFHQAILTMAPPPRDRWPLRLEPIGLLPSRLSLGDRFREMRALFEALCLELGEPGVEHRLHTAAIVHQILALIVQVASARAAAPPRLDALLRGRLRLESELAADIPIGPLARDLGMSADHFIRRFKARFGVSPKSFRTRARVREALRLLRETDLEVKQIALRLGWRDDATLAGHLRRLVGFNPTDIRAGRPAPDVKLPAGTLYPVNLHVVPPDAGPNWFNGWMLPGRPRDTITQASADVLSSQRAAKAKGKGPLTRIGGARNLDTPADVGYGLA